MQVALSPARTPKKTIYMIPVKISKASDVRANFESLRNNFALYFEKILWWQMFWLCIFILFDSFVGIPFEISDEVLNTFMVSVFVETLGAIVVMIAFAFSSNEESKIVEVLTGIVQSFQKYKKDKREK